MKKILIFLAVLGVVTVLAGVIFVYAYIYLTVKNICAKETALSNQNCQDSLMLVVRDENKTFKERNDAVWVLGQMANKQSLPVLKSLYQGVPKEREPLDKTLSQYEIKKAITWCEQGNWTSWMYGGL